jgi:hypothetical protein
LILDILQNNRDSIVKTVYWETRQFILQMSAEFFQTNLVLDVCDERAFCMCQILYFLSVFAIPGHVHELTASQVILVIILDFDQKWHNALFSAQEYLRSRLNRYLIVSEQNTPAVVSRILERIQSVFASDKSAHFSNIRVPSFFSICELRTTRSLIAEKQVVEQFFAHQQLNDEFKRVFLDFCLQHDKFFLPSPLRFSAEFS